MKKTPRPKMALLILDMLNTFDFPEGKLLQPRALRAAKTLTRLKKKFHSRGHPVIYVNDNFGKWKSDWKKVFAACTHEHCLGKEIAEILKPEENDYFILKPKHSGFYSTTLEVLLGYLQVRTLVITGIAGNICVLFTANDAHMREYKVIVPRDCMASNTDKDHNFTLRQLKAVLKIRTPLSSQV